MLPACERLDTNRARDGRAVRHVPLRTLQSRATVALVFGWMYVIIGLPVVALRRAA